MGNAWPRLHVEHNNLLDRVDSLSEDLGQAEARVHKLETVEKNLCAEVQKLCEETEHLYKEHENEWAHHKCLEGELRDQHPIIALPQ